MIIFYSETITVFSDMKDSSKTKPLLSLFILFFIYNCAGPAYRKLSAEDSEALLLMKDSLLQKHGNTKPLLRCLVQAHNSFGISAMEEQNYSAAIDHFNKSQELIATDTTAKYYVLMAEGHLLYDKGNKNGLWDAIEKFSKAAQLYGHRGEPYYYIGLIYRKLGNTDFDLMLESYNKALALTLPEKIRAEVEDAKENALHREKKLKTFWK